jgi:hypothetical protein
MLVTRGAGHYSLVAAAPLPIFIALLLKTRAHARMRDAVALGITVAWAFSADVYYAVYCILIAAGFLAAELVTLESWHRVDGRKSRLTWALDLVILCVAGLIVAILVSRGWSFQFLGRVVRMRGLYTPMLVLTTLLAARVWLTWRPEWKGFTLPDLWRMARLCTVGALVTAAVLSPVLYAMGVRIAQGQFVSPKIFWRSSPRGLDLLAILAPNPNHPLAPESLRAWLTARPDGYLEAVGSISFVAIGAILFAMSRGWRPPRLWTAGAIGAMLVALGPFVYVAGVNTRIPGPWALLRYVPIVGLARSPARFYVVAMLALAIVLAVALVWLRKTIGLRPVVAITALLVIELLPAPRLLASARVPDFYYAIASDPRPNISVLELPFGIRDGASSVGNFTARSQFVQIAHGKPILGGYLSRVSRRRVERIRRLPVLDALLRLSEGKELSEAEIDRAAARVPRFVARTNLGYVVIDRKRAPPPLVRFAVDHLDLEELATDGDLTLYCPRHPVEGLR